MVYVIEKVLNFLILYLLLYIFFKEKLTDKTIKFIITFIIAFISIFEMILVNSQMNTAFVDLAVSVFIVFLLINERWYNIILPFSLCYTGASIVYQIVMILSGLLSGKSLIFVFNSWTYIITAKMITIIILLVLCILRKYFIKNISIFTNLNMFIIFIIFLLCGVLIFNLEIKNPSEKLIIVVNYSLAISCVIMVIICFYLILEINNRKKYQNMNKIKEEYIGSLKEYFQQIKDNSMETRKIRHDMKTHISTMKYLLDHKCYTEMEEYFSEIGMNMELSDVKIPSVGNEIVDAVLFYKMKDANDKKIKINYEGLLPKKLNISQYDICTIISNLLNNAIEYCEIAHFDTIKFSTGSYQDYLAIKVTNPVKEEFDLKVIKNGTSKLDKNNHGFGLKNVDYAIKKYGGDFSIQCENREFTVICTIPNVL